MIDDIINSLGVGTQSTYVSLGLTEEFKIKGLWDLYGESKIIDIFSNTGAEKPETIKYWNEVLIPILKRNDREYYEVESDKGKLYDYYKQINQIPMRMQRMCTDYFKKKPIKAKIKALYPAVHYKNPIRQMLGITVDEIQRMKPNKVKYLQNIFPLIELRLSRDDVIKQYNEWGLPTPVKSGCWCCPFSRPSEFYEFSKQYPSIANKGIELEANARKFDKNKSKYELYLIRDKPLQTWINIYSEKERINKQGIANQERTDSLFFDYDEDQDECSGYCFN